jgi:hypothetical protein
MAAPKGAWLLAAEDFIGVYSFLGIPLLSMSLSSTIRRDSSMFLPS